MARKLTAWLPVTDELLEDVQPDPNVCQPWSGWACFIHTFASWHCEAVIA